jgi:hypothetical protein
MLSEEAFSAEASHLHKWAPLCILQPYSPKGREFHMFAAGLVPSLALSGY